MYILTLKTFPFFLMKAYLSKVFITYDKWLTTSLHNGWEFMYRKVSQLVVVTYFKLVLLDSCNQF